MLAWRCHTHNSSQNVSLRPLHWAVIMGRQQFQPNQEIKCLFAQLDRPTTNQSNVVCDYSSGGSLACFCVYWTKRCRMSPDVSGTRRAQAALLPGARYEPRVSPVPSRRPGSSARGICPASYKPALTIWLVWSSVHHRIKPVLLLVGLVCIGHNFSSTVRDARPNSPSKQCCGRG